jgi:hypothetical protein
MWLCSDQAAFITGTALPIDGGMLSGVPSFNVSSDKKLFGRDTR